MLSHLGATQEVRKGLHVRQGMDVLRRRWLLISLTMLPVALVLDGPRRNGLVWNAGISCEMTEIYKPYPKAYLTTAKWLQLPPAEILMVACHSFDLDAAHSVGYRCAVVRRPAEWGPAAPPNPHPNPAKDFIADDFVDLAQQLERALYETRSSARNATIARSKALNVSEWRAQGSGASMKLEKQ